MSPAGGPRRAGGKTRPPRLAGWLLDRLDASGSVRGDLDEEYRRYGRRQRGRARAHLWYWGQVLRSAPYLLARSDRRSGAALASDLAQALRFLRRRPGPSALVVLTLGLALGVNTTVLSLAHAVVFRPLPFANADRLVRLHPDELFSIDLQGARRVAEEASSLEAVLPWGRTLFTLTGTDPAEELRGALVADDHFQSLGIRPALGRAFLPEDARVWPPEAVILAHDVWTRRFGAAPEMVGRRIEVGGRARTLVGVMGPEHVPMEPDWEAWSPLPSDATMAGGRPLAMNALLRAGVPLGSARSDIRRALGIAWREGGATISDGDLAEVGVIGLRAHLLGPVDRPMTVLVGAVVFVLLLAAANVGNILLAQGSRRADEVAVRASLGAGRGRIVRQLVLEVLVLATAGTLVALLLSAGLHGWVSTRLPGGLPRAGQWALGPVTVAYALAAGLAAGLLAGVLPSWWTAGGGDGAAVLRGGGRRASRRLATVLVGVQVALSVLLVVGAGLMGRSFAALSAVDPGFRPEGAVAVRVAPPSGRYGDAESLDRFYGSIRAEVLRAPGVQAAGAIMFLPMTPGGAWASYRTDAGDPAEGDLPSMGWRAVTPGYFEAMGIRLVAGRTLDERDRGDGVRVAVINETMAREAFGERDPVGGTLLLGSRDPETVLVVGVVADVRQSDLRTTSHPELYQPLAQSPMERLYVVARTAGDEEEALTALQDAVLQVDSDVILSRSATVSELVAGTTGDTRFLAQLLAVFGLLALVVGGVGIYGVTAHAVAARQREMGIRMALGAAGRRVAGWAMVTGMAPVVAGILVGLVAAWAAAGLLGSLLYGVAPQDPLTFVTVPIVMAAVALLALLRPLARAWRTDPVEALRSE